MLHINLKAVLRDIPGRHSAHQIFGGRVPTTLTYPDSDAAPEEDSSADCIFRRFHSETENVESGICPSHATTAAAHGSIVPPCAITAAPHAALRPTAARQAQTAAGKATSIILCPITSAIRTHDTGRAVPHRCTAAQTWDGRPTRPPVPAPLGRSCRVPCGTVATSRCRPASPSQWTQEDFAG